MRISYEWLKEYIDIEKTPAQLAEDLSSFGFAVESIEQVNSDFILDLEINPNRGDCLSTLGMAREVAALYGLRLTADSLRPKIKEEFIDKEIGVLISEPKICPRFTARIIDNIEIQESPKWLQERLKAYGFRPINNIVDITNYVMLATGQPLHAFDWAKIKDGKMNIHLSYKDERLITLDGKEHILPKDIIVISDQEKIYDLAGIMGGINSEVNKNTKTIILQAAIFDPILIRRASKKLMHTTDASYRYERGVDPEGTLASVDMAAMLIRKSSPNVKISKITDVEVLKNKERTIALDLDKVNRLLGTRIKLEQAKDYLSRLNFKCSASGKQLRVRVPPYRIYDIKIWQDLSEEIARIYGYAHILSKKPPITKVAPLKPNWQKRETLKEILGKMGFTEICSSSFCDQKQIELLGYETSQVQEIANPLSRETQYLRPSLLSSLLTQISKNSWAPEIAVFEVGKVFYKNQEIWQIGLAVSHNLESALKEAASKLSIGKEITNIEQRILNFYKIRRGLKIIVATLDEINLPLKEISKITFRNQYREISKYPPTVRDLAFVVDKKIQADDIIDSIRNISDKIFLVELFDEFESPKLGEGKKNLAFHIWLEDLERPVSEKETNRILENIIKIAEEKFGGHLRS